MLESTHLFFKFTNQRAFSRFSYIPFLVGVHYFQEEVLLDIIYYIYISQVSLSFSAGLRPLFIVFLLYGEQAIVFCHALRLAETAGFDTVGTDTVGEVRNK